MRLTYVPAAGACLCGCAIATLALNVFVSPLLPTGPFSAVAASPIYLVRQWIAAIVAMFLVFGLAGLRESRLLGEQRFAAIAQVLAMLGQVLLFAVEYGQAAIIHDYAVRAPNALDSAFKDMHGALAIGAVIAIATFYVGWLLLAMALVRSRGGLRLAGWVLLVGFVATPVINSVKTLGAAGGVLASLIVGAGWLLLGLGMIRRPDAGNR